MMQESVSLFMFMLQIKQKEEDLEALEWVINLQWTDAICSNRNSEQYARSQDHHTQFKEYKCLCNLFPYTGIKM
jgi:hypothetical protein